MSVASSMALWCLELGAALGTVVTARRGARRVRRDRWLGRLVGDRSRWPSMAERSALARARFLASAGRTRVANGLPGAGPRLDRTLGLAGLGDRRDEIRGRRLLLCAGGFLTGLAVIRSPVPTAIVGTTLAFVALRVADLHLARTAARRQSAIGRQVPELLEFLLATTDAGLAPAQAFERAGSMLRPPLGAELGVMVRAVEFGQPWREALDALVARTSVPSLRRVGTALARSSRLGTSLDVSLRALTEDLRGERRATAEDAARRAPVKMLFPLVFLILPAFLLLTVGPVLLETLRSLH